MCFFVTQCILHLQKSAGLNLKTISELKDLQKGVREIEPRNFYLIAQSDLIKYEIFLKAIF